MKRVLILLALCIALAIGVVPTHAASPITVTVNGFTNNFPQNLVFELEAQSSAKITRVELLAEVNWTSAGITYLTGVHAQYENSSPVRMADSYELFATRHDRAILVEYSRRRRQYFADSQTALSGRGCSA